MKAATTWTVVSRKRPAPEGFARVRPTVEEAAEYRRGHRDHRPGVDRLQCLGCGKRIWGSGLGIGSHRRACEHYPEAYVAWLQQQTVITTIQSERTG